MHLGGASHHYPKAWKAADAYRAGRGRDWPDWPQWCYLPMGAWHEVVNAGNGRTGPLPLVLVADVGRLAALGAWRVSQGIYRFDPALYEALVTTPLNGDIPDSVLFHLPEWCVYIETPDLEAFGKPLFGVFAHLESDMNTGQVELRLALDVGTGEATDLVPLTIHLGQGSLLDAVTAAWRAAEPNLAGVLGGAAPPPALVDDMLALQAGMLAPIVSLLLYLCSEAADYTRPPPVRPKKTSKGWRMFAPDKPAIWDVGVRMGAALRRAYQAEETQQPPTLTAAGRARPRAHVRRAHWHTFWKGPRDGERTASLKWLPPIAVALDDEALPAVIHPVRGDGDAAP